MKNRIYDKLFAARSAVERWEDEVLEDLRPIGERYIELCHKLGKNTGDYFPATVTSIEESYHGSIYVKGYWHRRGCTDPESCTIPKELVYADEAGREAFFADMERQIAEQEEARKRAQDAKDREQYEALKNRFEGGQE